MGISIRNRIYWSFLILVLLFVINGLVTEFTLHKGKKLSDHISTVIDPSQQGLSDFRSLLIESKMFTTNWVFLRSNQEDKQALQSLHTAKYPALKRKLTGLFSQLGEPRMTDSLGQVFKNFENLLGIEKQLMASLGKFTDYDDPVIKLTAEQTIEDEVIPRTSQLLQSLDQVNLHERDIKIREFQNLESYSTRLRTLILVLAIVIVLSGVFLSSYMTAIITHPISLIIQMVNDLGKGKLDTVNLPVNRDEIGQMVGAVNELSNKLRETALFADEIGKREFTSKFTPLSEEDILGKALLTMKDNLKTSGDELMQTAENLIQRNKELEQFTYIISHNLRAPVANIIGLYQLLRLGADDEQEFLTLISSLGTSVQKLDEVIIDLNLILDVKQQVHEQMEEISFTQIVEDIKNTFDVYTQQGLIEIKCDFSTVDTIHSLKNYLYSIFYNLISNSIKFKRPEEKLLLQITSSNKKNKISVHFEDNGKGIDLQLNGSKLFGLYRRFDTSVEGKGMGLYMVKTQVETLGGSIKVQSNADAGVTFIIDLPKNT
ncbi:MAG: ATP-binding protein [Bacteroidota bacterium]|nr:ATP-binding protein [Bacteroidota bacterium]